MQNSSAACDSAWAAAAVAHRAVVESLQSHVGDLRLLGEKLLAAKLLTPHGLWLARLQEHGIHAKRAQRAMAIAQGKGTKRHGVAFEGGENRESAGAGGAVGEAARASDREQELEMYSDANLDMLQYLEPDEDEEDENARQEVEEGAAAAISDPSSSSASRPETTPSCDPLAVQLDFTGMYNEAARERDWGTSWMHQMAERVGRGDSAAMAELKRVVGEMRRVPAAEVAA